MSENVVEAEAARKTLFTRAFWLLLVTQTCFGMSFSAFFLLPKFLKLELLASETQIGLLSAVGAVAGVIAFPAVGTLNDRYGKKPFITLGALLMTSTAYLTLFVREVGPLLFVLRVAQGLSFALLFNSATTLVSDEVAPARLGSALGLFGASMLSTNALSPAFSEWIANQFGWPRVFQVSTAWGIAAVLLSTAVIEPRKNTQHGSRKAAPKSLLFEQRPRRVLILTMAGGAGFGTLFTFHQPYALELGIREVSGFFVAYAIAALVMRLGFLTRMDRFGRQNVSAAAMFVYALSVVTAAFLRPGLLVPLGAITGLAHGVLYPVFNALAVEGVALDRRGSMMALYHGGFNAGMSVALLIGGAFAERFGYPALFYSVGFVTFVGAVALFRADLSHSL